MPPTNVTMEAIMRTLRQVWVEVDETRQAYLLRELEALIERYRQELT